MTPAVYFYAPLKPPGSLSPSGDRTVGRLMLTALRAAGYAPEVASELRTYEPSGDRRRQAALREASRAEVRRVVAEVGGMAPGRRPRLWFTYHCYYKAPDWIGPAAAEALGVPYVVAEGSRAAKRAGGRWALAHRGAEAALDRAACIFASTRHDREALTREGPLGQSVVDLPPFVDPADWSADSPSARSPRDRPLRLLAVAMMRPGAKLASYARLAAALDGLPGTGWRLDLVGDGSARAEVEALFAPFGDRITFHGRLDDRARLAGLYARSDLLVWPAVDEAYGVALLEAQAASLPVLAGRTGGVPDVVRHGSTGILVPAHDPAAFAAALADTMAHPDRLQPMREAAAAFVRRERALDGAAAILRRALQPLVSNGRAP